MRRAVAVLFAVAICVVAFGFFRGWFALSSPSPPAGSDAVNVNLETDIGQMKTDAEAVKDTAVQLSGNAAGGPAKPVDRPAVEVPPNRTPSDDGRSPEVKPNVVPPGSN